MTGIQQDFILTGTRGISARVTVQETYDTLLNTSDIQVGVEVMSGNYGGHIYYLSGFVAAQGETLQAMSAYAGTHFVYVEKTGTYYPISATDEKYTGSPWRLAGILHDTDGSKTITLELQLTGWEAEGKGANGWEVAGTVEVPLTHIPRASTVAATDARVESVSLVVVNRKDATYCHSIQYQFGSLTGFLTEDGTTQQETKLQQTQLAFLIPESFYTQIPNDKTGSCTLVCRTYAGGIQIGEAQSCSFTVSADPGVCAPVVTGTVKDGNPATVVLTGDDNLLVRYSSNALCVITAAPQKGSAITEKQVDAVTVTESTHIIEGVEKDQVLFAASDSRGYTTQLTVQKTMIPYVHLTCHPAVKRTDPTSGNALLTVTGDCFFGSFGKESNALQLQYRVAEGAWQTLSLETEENHYTAQMQLTGLDYTTSHTIEVQAADKLQTVTKTLVLGKGVPVFDWGEHDFAFHVPVRLAGMPQTDQEAACKAYADRKISVVKLWQNPDTLADFPAQTVVVSLSGYDAIFCAAVTKAGNAEYQLSSVVENKIGNAGHINSFSADDTDFWLNWRRFSVAYNGVRFDGAYMRDMKNDSVYEDWRARSVPVAIYGVKGIE